MDRDRIRLVAVTADRGGDPQNLLEQSLAAVRGGATMVQLRLKHADARTLVEVTRLFVASLPVPVIVNDRADIALAARAAGVHLGADDLPVDVVRAIAPGGFIIGASVGSPEEVANSALADYVGIGPAFFTGTKADAGGAIGPEGIRSLAEACGKPAVAIGGITPENVALLRHSGVAGVAVVTAIFESPSPEEAARELRNQVDGWGS